MKTNALRLVALSASSCLISTAHAAVSVTLSPDASGLFNSFEYTQDFNSLANVTSATNQAWQNDTTLKGWSLFNSKKAAITYYRASAGAEASGYFYSYGVSGDTDRALGSIGANNTYWGSPAENALSSYAALSLRNDSGMDLNGVYLSFDAEQWRIGQNNATTDTLDFRFGFGNTFADVTDWLNPGASFKFNTTVKNTTTGAGVTTDGNTVGVQYLGGDIALNWQQGQTLWFTWIDYNSAGFDHGVAIDNVYVSAAVPTSTPAVPEPSTHALMVVALLTLGVAKRARARQA